VLQFVAAERSGTSVASRGLLTATAGWPPPGAMWRFFAAERVAFKRATHRTNLPLVTVTEEVQGSFPVPWFLGKNRS
jgi:hypothetical protein